MKKSIIFALLFVFVSAICMAGPHSRPSYRSTHRGGPRHMPAPVIHHHRHHHGHSMHTGDWVNLGVGLLETIIIADSISRQNQVVIETPVQVVNPPVQQVPPPPPPQIVPAPLIIQPAPVYVAPPPPPPRRVVVPPKMIIIR